MEIDMKKKTLGLFAALVLAVAPALAQAPKSYGGYNGKKWTKDFGIAKGGCDSAAMGSEATKKDRSAAVLRGDSKLGKLDNGDRGCAGHALELTGEKKTVAWTNKSTGMTYRLTPTHTFKRNNAPCREFTTSISDGKKQESVRSVACRSGDGEWVLKS
jgi:surface antigen